MTDTSADSLIPDIPKRTEADALRERINRAASAAYDAVAYAKGNPTAAWPLKNALEHIIRILEGGK